MHASHGGSGYSAHGDFFNAWEPGELESRIEDCLWRELKCDASGVPLDQGHVRESQRAAPGPSKSRILFG